MSGDLTTLAAELALVIADYREGEIAKPTREHVVRWIGQFDGGDRLPLLRETLHVLKQMYVPRSVVDHFVDHLIEHDKLTAGDPKAFWSGVGFLRLQTRSQSQADLLSVLDARLKAKLALSTSRSKSTNANYVYIDDAMFSGTQVRHELINWINSEGEANAIVHVIVIAYHRRGQWFADKRIREAAKAKGIRVTWWRIVEIDDWRKDGKEAEAQVLWPARVPDDPLVEKWLAARPEDRKFFATRKAPAPNGPFSSDEARDRYEQTFLKKGAFIFSLSRDPNASMRPLGFHSLNGFGFGTMFATYRNCPNNCPLVLWWGDPDAGKPLNQWYPLLPRRVRRPDAKADFADWDF